MGGGRLLGGDGLDWHGTDAHAHFLYISSYIHTYIHMYVLLVDRRSIAAQLERDDGRGVSNWPSSCSPCLRQATSRLPAPASCQGFACFGEIRARK